MVTLFCGLGLIGGTWATGMFVAAAAFTMLRPLRVRIVPNEPPRDEVRQAQA